MKKATIDKKAIVEELLKQDEQLKVIFERREKLAKITKEAGFYDEVWEMLFSDHKGHYDF